MSLVGKVARLRVVAVKRIGAYLDWGEPGELFLPIGEQTEILSVGEEIIVFVAPGPCGPVASMRLDGRLDEDTSGLKLEQRVDLLVVGETALGYSAVIDGKNVGVLYKSEVFQKLEYGSQVTGYVKKIREDGKVDLILQPFGNKGSRDVGRLILDRLTENGGFLPFNDASSPQAIYSAFGVSKKKYKMALGSLYRRQLVSLDPDGIRLL